MILQTPRRLSVRASAGEGRLLSYTPTADGPLAQAVEHLPFKQRVAGSSPARLTIPLPECRSRSTRVHRLARDCHAWVILKSDLRGLVRTLAVLACRRDAAGPA